MLAVSGNQCHAHVNTKLIIINGWSPQVIEASWRIYSSVRWWWLRQWFHLSGCCFMCDLNKPIITNYSHNIGHLFGQGRDVKMCDKCLLLYPYLFTSPQWKVALHRNGPTASVKMLYLSDVYTNQMYLISYAKKTLRKPPLPALNMYM